MGIVLIVSTEERHMDVDQFLELGRSRLLIQEKRTGYLAESKTNRIFILVKRKFLEELIQHRSRHKALNDRIHETRISDVVDASYQSFMPFFGTQLSSATLLDCNIFATDEELISIGVAFEVYFKFVFFSSLDYATFCHCFYIWKICKNLVSKV